MWILFKLYQLITYLYKDVLALVEMGDRVEGDIMGNFGKNLWGIVSWILGYGVGIWVIFICMEYILETKLFLIMKILRLDINKYLCCQQNHLSPKLICSIARNI